MISCRIVLNELPDDVLEQMLRVDEVEESDLRWRLINRKREMTTFQFSPRPGGQSWYVQWGYHYSWRHFKASLMGRDEATMDWKKVSIASRMGIPVPRYRLLATPRLLTGSMDTLLAREYLKDAKSVGRFLIDQLNNAQTIERTLFSLGDLLGAVHARALLHGDYTLDTILIQYDDPERIAVMDWHEMHAAPPDDTLAYREELAVLLNELVHMGLDDERLRIVLRAYADHMPWSVERFDEILRHAAPEPSGV